jgi:hypothetical protein
MMVAAPIIGVLAVQVAGDTGAAGTSLAVSRMALARTERPAPRATAAPHTTVSASSGAADATLAVPSPPSTPAAVAPTSGPSASDTSDAAVVADPSTESQVAQDLIVAIDTESHGAYHIASTAGNVSLIDAWMTNEGGLWADNPLNTSLYAGRYPHQFTTTGDDTGIPIFPDIAIGIAATATTLLSNRVYADILDVLSQDSGDCAAFAHAVIDSPWASSHYGYDPARFCGVSAATGTVAAPVVTACLQLPPRGKRFALRAARVPGTCGRFARHAGPSRHSGAHHLRASHNARCSGAPACGHQRRRRARGAGHPAVTAVIPVQRGRF